MKRSLRYSGLGLISAAAIFIAATALAVRSPLGEFKQLTGERGPAIISDRNGVPLSASYDRRWNMADRRPLFELPEPLVEAFVFSEDREFYDHYGVDWRARAAALWQNVRRGKTIRGASTITEQVVRLIHPRERNIWSKWLEGIEAAQLERAVSKPDILEFYLNQVPFAANRRGVVQAARYYFNRDLDTLSVREMLALAVLARAPSAYDLYRHPGRIDASLDRLAASMAAAKKLSEDDYHALQGENFETMKPSLPVDARHFARFARLHAADAQIVTTLDASLQRQVQQVLDQRLAKLAAKNVSNGAALIADYQTGEILAWVVGGALDPQTAGGEIDPVTTPRQPGSTLKPFLYASALDKGWTAATILNDAPIAEKIGGGLHRFRNYSGGHYGPITMREALGNSLNIPAILTIGHVGVRPFLSTLQTLGFASLDRDASVYDEGLALGNGEVTLYELVTAYAALANRGVATNLHAFSRGDNPQGHRVFTEASASIIGDILSDPRARALEFGSDSILNLPVRTAAKTGTSTDYRDAWAVGYNDRYVVGLWMGNLDRAPMKDVTGSMGPALALRSIFNLLNRDRDTAPLYLSPALFRREVCIRPETAGATCPRRSELFADEPAIAPSRPAGAVELVRPTDGLRIAKDPRIPASHQKFRFELANLPENAEVNWSLDGQPLATTTAPTLLWPVEKGTHRLVVSVAAKNRDVQTLPETIFHVR